MNYILDGYNILFTLLESKKEFAQQRQDLIDYFQAQFASLHLTGLLIFDGAHRVDEESGRAYRSPLQIIYTPRGQNADGYIIELVQRAQNPKEVTVVTSDGGLTRQVKSFRVHVQAPRHFLRFLHQKSATRSVPEKQLRDTPSNLRRLQQIFEDLDRDPED